jgi:ubiquinone/menaquinone biosynthesis C-methylase UbiE
MTEAASSTEWYLKDYHRRRPGTTTAIFGDLPIVADGNRYESSYHYLAQNIPHVSDSLRILDLACGDGFLLRLLAEGRQQELELHGIDFSEAELAAANLRLRGAASLICADARRLPLESASIDVVVSHMAMMLTDEMPTVIREIRRVLRRDGRICAVVGRPRQGKDRDAVFPLIEAALAEANVLQALPWGDRRMMSPEGIAELLQDQFEGLWFRNLECPMRLDPGAYWENLQATYSVDILPPSLQAELRVRVLHAIAPLIEQYGKVPTSFALRLFVASVSGAG